MAQIVNRFGDFIYEEPQTGGGTPISNATDFPPGFTEQIQTGGGTPIDAFTQPTYTPFLLNQIEIDEITIKKIYDLFPRSLRVEQLTSNELLDLLRSQVDEKDAEIQRLLEIIANFSETTLDLSTLESLLSSLGGELTGGILDALNNTGVQIDDAQLSQEIANLQANGYVQINQTLLFAKVVDVVQTNTKFIDVPFVAVQRTLGLPNNPTNVFKFSTYSQEATVYSIPGKSGEVTETISLGYAPFDQIYDDVGLNDGREDTTIYNGNVYILASNENITGTITKSRLKKGTSIGSCKLQRRG